MLTILNNEQINKIQSLQDLKPGDKVIITAEASVVKCEMCQKMKGSGNVDESNNMDIQIEKMNMSPIVTKKLEDMDMNEYRNARRMKT